jgi:uncharacterized membrane protein
MIEMKSFFFAALLENDLETAERWKNLILTGKRKCKLFSIPDQRISKSKPPFERG